jgi:hypothetical protein
VLYLGAVASMTETFREVAPEGQAVIVHGGGFDPYTFGIYTAYDEHHYQRQQTARFDQPDRVSAEDCHLDTANTHLILTCGSEAITIDPFLKAKTN